MENETGTWKVQNKTSRSNCFHKTQNSMLQDVLVLTSLPIHKKKKLVDTFTEQESSESRYI